MKGLSFNIYKEIAIALKANEWRLPGLVAPAGHGAAHGAAPMPPAVTVPHTYGPGVYMQTYFKAPSFPESTCSTCPRA